MRLYENFKSHLCYIGRVVKYMVILMPLYGLNVMVNIASSSLEFYLLRRLANPQIAARFEDDLNTARVKLNNEILYLNSEQNRDNMET